MSFVIERYFRFVADSAGYSSAIILELCRHIRYRGFQHEWEAKLLLAAYQDHCDMNQLSCSHSVNNLAATVVLYVKVVCIIDLNIHRLSIAVKAT